jgi:hypothetical protein
MRSIIKVYNFEEGHSINPGEGHKDDGTTITLAMKVSLDNTAYNIMEGEEETSLSDLAEDLYEEDEGIGGMDFEMEQAHHNTRRAIANTSSSEEGGAGSSSKSSTKNKENPDSPNGGKEEGVGHTAQLTTDLAGTTLQADEAQPAEGQAYTRERPALEDI